MRNSAGPLHGGMPPTMTTSDNFPDILRELCYNQPLAVLATTAGSAPYANLVAIAFALDLHHLFFATSRATRKWHNLSTNPQVSFLMDNRSNQVTDFSQAAAATILGTAKELTGVVREEGRNLYLAKHPHLGDFLAAPACALFQVTIEQIYLVTHFQEVMKFDFSSERRSGI
jgi:heme iron utilization protein